eukprot:gb/GECG01001501.1/.p1 GENE.gb/GECG01001501.1/~~gb/GECG01001501.1/.p1  ORF type:complete len:487 (+),score=78.02 gb/GECG01001501.1/:1-1461(+)
MQKHSSECTEFFYKTHIDEHVPVSDVLHDHVKQKTLDVLRREGLNYNQHPEGEHANGDGVNSNPCNYEDEEEGSQQTQQQHYESQNSCFELSDRLYKLAVSDNLNIDDLSREEKIQFRRALVNGELSKYVPEWEPWWKKSEKQHNRIVHRKLGKSFIQEIRPNSTERTSQNSTRDSEIPDDAKLSGSDPVEESHLSKEDYRAAQDILRDVKRYWEEERLTPSIKCCAKRIPMLSELYSGEVSKEITNDIVNALLSYAYTVRTYYGDVDSNVEEVAEVFINCSSVLNEKQHFASLESSVNEGITSISRLTSSLSRRSILKTASMLLTDVREILSCSTFVKDATWDCYRILEAAKRSLKNRSREASQATIRANIYNNDENDDSQKHWAHSNLRRHTRRYKEIENKLWFILAYVSDSTNQESLEKLRDGVECYQKEYEWKMRDQRGGAEYEKILSSNATGQVPFISTLESFQEVKKQNENTATDLSEMD